MQLLGEVLPYQTWPGWEPLKVVPFPGLDLVWKKIIFRMSHLNLYPHTWLFSLRSDCSWNLGTCFVGIGASKSSKLPISLLSAIIKNTGSGCFLLRQTAASIVTCGLFIECLSRSTKCDQMHQNNTLGHTQGFSFCCTNLPLLECYILANMQLTYTKWLPARFSYGDICTSEKKSIS